MGSRAFVSDGKVKAVTISAFSFGEGEGLGIDGGPMKRYACELCHDCYP